MSRAVRGYRPLLALIAVLALGGLVASAASLDLNAQSITPSENNALGVPKSQPTVTTQASAGGVVRTAVTDTATLSNGTANMGGILYYTLWGPSSTVDCSAKVAEVSTPVNGNGAYTSPAVTPTQAGTYYWTVRYVGDLNNSNIGETSCGAANETVTLAKATPTLTPSASPASLTVGGSASDVGVLASGYNPTGSITFALFPTSDATCSGSPVFTKSAPVNGNNSYPSNSYTTTAAGSFKWQASYSGDGNNNRVTGTCGGTSQLLTVDRASPTLTTSATVSVTVGSTVTDTATLVNSYHGTRTITFSLYGPSPTQACTTLVGSVTRTVSGDGTYTSPEITPPHAGTYWWIANYDGDSNNNATTNPCGETNESTTVDRKTPTATPTATSSVTVGGGAQEQVQIAGGFGATGSITFTVYASTDATCQGTTFFTSTKPVSGDSTYTSDAWSTNAVGDYKWGFSYTGDGDNNAVSRCGGTGQLTTVNKASPTITTTPSAGVVVGNNVSDSAVLNSAFNPSGGSIEFTLYSNAACTSQVFTSTNSLTFSSNTWSATSGSHTTSTAGTYYWKARYAGNANNNSYTTSCGGAGDEQVVVSKASPTLTVSAPGTGTAGTAIPASSITAALANAFGSYTTLTFRIFGPLATAPTDCTTATPVATVGTATPSGNGTYQPGSGFTPGSAGNYWWYVSAPSDGNNNAASSTCGSTMSKTVVSAPAANVSAVLKGAATDTGATSSSSVTNVATTSGRTELILVYRESAIGQDTIPTAGITGPFTGTPVAVTSSVDFSGKHSLFVWRGVGNGATGSVTVSFTGNNKNVLTVVQVIELSGNDTATPIVQSPAATGTTSPATATLTSPGSGNAELVLIGATGNTTVATPAAFTQLSTQNGATGSGYSVKSAFNATAQASTSSALGANVAWGTIALEIKRG